MRVSNRFAGMIGNILENYDNALFGLLAPFIAPLFFGDLDPVLALVLTFAMLPLGILTRPLGSLFFGKIGDHFGRKHALFISLVGMAFSTVFMGCLPLHREVGIAAPILLMVSRMVQNFCAAGEVAGGAIFVLENTELPERSLMSSFYDASSMGGILIASFLVTFLSAQGLVDEGWRFLFFGGGVTAVVGLYLRHRAIEEVSEPVKEDTSTILQVIKEEKRALLAITLASGLSCSAFGVAFTLMNGYIPLVTTLSMTDVMQVYEQ